MSPHVKVPVRVLVSITTKTNWFVYLKEWIMEQWEKNYYISSIAGATNGSSLVVMSKGLPKCSNLVFLVYFSFNKKEFFFTIFVIESRDTIFATVLQS